MVKGKIRKKDEGANGTWMAEKSNSMRHLHPLLSTYVSYRRRRNQPDSSFVTISFILVTDLFYKALISQGEF